MGFLTGGLVAESYDRSYSDAQLARRILGYFRPYLGVMALVALMVLLMAVASTTTPFLIAWGIDQLAASPTLQVMLGLAALVTGMGALGWGLNYVRQWFAARAVGDVVLALREDAFQAVLRRDRSFFDQHAAGRIISRVTTDTQDFATVVTLSIDLLSQLGLVLVVSIVMFVVNWRLALVTVATGPVVILVALGFRWLARQVMRQSQRATAEVNAVVGETISGIAVAKNFRQERTLFEDFLATNRMAYAVQIRRVAVFGSIFPLLNTLSGMATAVIIYAGGLLVRDGAVSLGDWYLFVQALMLFFYPITSLASFWSQFQQGLAASERVFALIDAEPLVVQAGAARPGRLSGMIAYDQVRFRYGAGATTGDGQPMAGGGRPTTGDRRPATNPSGVSPLTSAGPEPVEGHAPPPNNSDFALLTSADASWVLDGFSLAIPAGQNLAIVGHTGSGKSSLVKLIMRFYEFQGGAIRVDGHDIRGLDLEHYRRQIGYVPQTPLLFAGSVADNIRYGRPEASDAEALAAARQLDDGSWLADLPQGLATEVGERGARLSLGQRQLVALARVLLQDPAILVLDEATASIDPFTEHQVQAALAAAMRGRTSIVIAHRLSTVQAADRIIVLRKGRIIESGRHEELLAQGGHYAELYATYFRHQSLDYRPW